MNILIFKKIKALDKTNAFLFPLRKMRYILDTPKLSEFAKMEGYEISPKYLKYGL